MVTALLAVSFNTSASNNAAAAATKFSQNMSLVFHFVDLFGTLRRSLPTPNKILI